MEKILDYIDYALADIIEEIQDESLGGFELHNTGHIMVLGNIKNWATQDGATRDDVFRLAEAKLAELDRFIGDIDDTFLKLTDAEQENFEFIDDYMINDGKRCELIEFLVQFGVIERVDGEDEE